MLTTNMQNCTAAADVHMIWIDRLLVHVVYARGLWRALEARDMDSAIALRQARSIL